MQLFFGCASMTTGHEANHKTILWHFQASRSMLVSSVVKVMNLMCACRPNGQTDKGLCARKPRGTHDTVLCTVGLAPSSISIASWLKILLGRYGLSATLAKLKVQFGKESS